MKDDSESISNKKKSHKLAESLHCHLINESAITQTLQKQKSLLSSSRPHDFDELDYDLSFELLSEIALTQLDLKFNVIVNMLVLNDARCKKFEVLERSGKARLIILQEETGNPQNIYDDRYVLKVSAENGSFDVNEISAKIFHFLSTTKKDDVVTKSQKPKKEPTNDHLHELILAKEPRKREIHCSSCSELVSGLSYACAECNHFTFHKLCAESTKVVQDCPLFFLEDRPKQYDFKNTNKCHSCNEFSDRCYDCLLQTNFTNGFLPAIVHDEKHDHFLNLIIVPFEINYRYICGICDIWGGSIGYKCYECCYDVHVSCITGRKGLSPYFFILNHLFNSVHIDNMKILKALISTKYDQPPLQNFATKRKVSLDALREKYVLLLISDLELQWEVFALIAQMYNEARLHDPSRQESRYEIVWILVVEQSTTNDSKQNQFEKLKANMALYSISHPSLLHPAVIKYIKEVWQFDKKPMLVAIDPKGKVVNPNAINMMWIWGNIAFPFTTSREKALWDLETRRLELLVDGIDPRVLYWIKEGRYICLYGGDDMKWIRKFTNTTKAVAYAVRVPLEMVYVGKRSPKEMVRSILEEIMEERLSHCWHDLTKIWLFWERIESMRQLMNKLGRKNDPIMKQIMTLLSFDASSGEWALLSRGGSKEIMIQAEGYVILTCLIDNYPSWGDVQDKDFLPTLQDYINKERNMKGYQMLVRPSETDHIDEMSFLRALFNAKDDQLPLYDGYHKTRISLQVLRRKTVLLYISDLEPPLEELSILEKLYCEARQHPSTIESQFEVVWVPVVDRSTPWNETKQKQFETLQSMIICYSVNDPSLLHPAAIKYIKEVWQFNQKPLLVAVDPQGKVVHPNAINMMWIWGKLSFPFTTSREKALWYLESWRLELLVDGIDPTVLRWIKEGRYICLYGGDDMEWIRKITNTTRAVAHAIRVPLEMVYVGKRNPKEKVRKILARITEEHLSYCWDAECMWFFWRRIESMIQSKNQLGQTTDQNDPIMKQITTLLSFDSSGDGWAIFTRGGSEEIMIQAEGHVILTCLRDYDHWKDEILDKGFLPTLQDQILSFKARNH